MSGKLLVEENVARVSEFASTSAVLPCDTATGRHYGQIKSGLRTRGRPIPENDIWIAAIARQYDLTLVSRDVHFAEVESLKVEAWQRRVPLVYREPLFHRSCVLYREEPKLLVTTLPITFFEH